MSRGLTPAAVVLHGWCSGRVSKCLRAQSNMSPTVVKVCAAVHAIGHVVIDPVMVASSGDPLIADDAVGSFKTELFPLASIITPNLPEAGHLLGRKVSMLRAAGT